MLRSPRSVLRARRRPSVAKPKRVKRILELRAVARDRTRLEVRPRPGGGPAGGGAGHDPELQGPAHHVVEGGRPGQHRLLRRLGHRGLAAALALRQGRAHPARRPALGPLRLDGRQGDRPVRLGADHLHRDRRHQPQVGARRGPQVRRGARERAPVRLREALRRRGAELLRARLLAEDQLLLQPHVHAQPRTRSGAPGSPPRGRSSRA